MFGAASLHIHMNATLEDMGIDDIIDYVVALGGVLVLRPQPGDGSPQIRWGDVFVYYAPDGVIPQTQPFATIVTKDYPDEPASGLDRPGVFRLNIAASRAEFAEVLGHDTRQLPKQSVDPSTPDVFFMHPVYGRAGWLAVVNPGDRTADTARQLLNSAHQAARRRFDDHRARRGGE
jgi:hypothetical protein